MAATNLLGHIAGKSKAKQPLQVSDHFIVAEHYFGNEPLPSRALCDSVKRYGRDFGHPRGWGVRP